MYGASEGLTTVVVEAEAVGGQAGTSSMIRNYLGFPRGISGMRLAQRARNQAIRFGTRFFTGWEVAGISPRGRPPRRAHRRRRRRARAPSSSRAASPTASCGAPGVDDLTGIGVFYGSAMTAAREMEGYDVVVVGGGNSAGQAAIHLARFAKSVTIMVRRGSLEETMSRYLINEIEWNPRVEVASRCEVAAAGGDGRLEWIDVKDCDTDEVVRRNAEGLFLLLGAEPHCDWLPDDVARDDRGFVLTGRDVPKSLWVDGLPPESLATSVSGVFAVGDIRAGSMKRVAAASGRGFVGGPARARLAEQSGVARVAQPQMRSAYATKLRPMTFSIRAQEWPRCSSRPIRRWNWSTPCRSGTKGSVSARSPAAPTPAACRWATCSARVGAVGVQVVDAGDGAVGADADVVLAADVHGVLDVGDDVGGGGVPVRVEEGHEVDADEAAAVGDQAQLLVGLVARQVAQARGSRCG